MAKEYQNANGLEAKDNSFRRGVMSLVILGLLQQEDMYGYQLVQQTQRQSGGRIQTQEGSLYPVLYKLLDQGCISDRKVLVGKRMTRVYYHLEPAGQERLKELTREYEEMTQGVFQIVRGESADAEQTVRTVVPVADPQPAAEDLETEKDGFVPSGAMRPGLCY